MATDTAVTHRMVRYAHRVTTGSNLDPLTGPEGFRVETWEVKCACGRVLTGSTEQAASDAYLAHLPNPNKGRR